MHFSCIMRTSGQMICIIMVLAHYKTSLRVSSFTFKPFLPMLVLHACAEPLPNGTAPMVFPQDQTVLFSKATASLSQCSYISSIFAFFNVPNLVTRNLLLYIALPYITPFCPLCYWFIAAADSPNLLRLQQPLPYRRLYQGQHVDLWQPSSEFLECKDICIRRGIRRSYSNGDDNSLWSLAFLFCRISYLDRICWQ